MTTPNDITKIDFAELDKMYAKQLTRERELELESLDNIEEYKGKWRNLHFRKDGSSVLDMDDSFDTEGAAKADVDIFIPDFKPPEEIYFLYTSERIPHRDYSHTIQIPYTD